jgi:Domain of unknown function (DUF1998)
LSDRKLRRAQTLTPFGVGAVFDIVGESFVAEDIARWKGRPHKIRAARIAALFGVSELRTAPPAPDSGTAGADAVPFFRFPQWLFCPGCRRMTRWKYTLEEPGRPPRCQRCRAGRQLVPMRFVSICGKGHLDDVDWVRWAHSDAKQREQKQCQRPDLRFNVLKGVGGGLQSLETRCATCDAARPLRGIASPDTAKRIGLKCRGRQPWLPSGEGEPCDAPTVIVQRGASNVHFPLVSSAIDIPPESDYEHYGSDAARIKNNPNFKLLESQPDHPMRDGLIGMVASEEAVDEATVRRALAEQLGTTPDATSGVEDSEEQVRRDEWVAFMTERDREPHPRDNFVVQHRDPAHRTRPGATGPAADSIAGGLHQLVLAHRLREIRVLRGFTRYDMQRIVTPDLGSGLDWLPAIEVFGEGIFFALSEQPLAAWEQRADVRGRVEPLVARLKRSIWSRFLPPVTPRFVMLHTLAHILIRQFVYESGYSSASLRERLYVAGPETGDPMAGMLIYTGAGDAEGTLGGLVRNGEPDWFVPTVLAALRTTAWCSLDPVCRESSGQGPDSLSLAGCHACSLVAETSCDHGNSLLDRGLLIDPELGYFADALRLSTDEAAEKVV